MPEVSEVRPPRYHLWRLAVQAAAFGLLVAVPFLNGRYHISFVQGWFQSLSIGRLWFVSPLEGLESLLTSRTIYLPLLVGMIPTVAVAVILGRLFCGWVCPIHFLSDVSDRVVGLFKRGRKDLLSMPRWTLWAALVGELILAMVLGAPLFVFLSPPGLVGRELMVMIIFHGVVLEGVLVLVVLGMNLVTRRFFCRYLCPLGGLLALLGARRRLMVALSPAVCTHCGACRRACPLGLDPAAGEAAGLHCWNCGECISRCRFGALAFRWRYSPPMEAITGTHGCRNGNRHQDG